MKKGKSFIAQLKNGRGSSQTGARTKMLEGQRRRENSQFGASFINRL